MTDYTELKRLAEHHLSLGHAYTVATPDAVLALIAENDAALREATSLAMAIWRRHYAKDSPNFQTFEKASSVIGQIDNMVAGLMSDIDQLKAENQAMAEFKAHMVSLREASGFDSWSAVLVDLDRLKAEVAGLRTGYEAYERVNAELKAEVEVFRGLLSEMRAIGNHAPAELTLRIDAAMGNSGIQSGTGPVRSVVAAMPCRELGEAFNAAYYAPRNLGSDSKQCRAGVLAVIDAAMGKGEQS